ncbi:hypothetical protein [Catenuloplanes japonicus]|uniref:hypothetical protein n=1 Tax=Catenuloplanes japonicus TaxID=33876 RepID=UPI0012F88B38|nr:hypothetical protein [Catenuloplanes japonicus]
MTPTPPAWPGRLARVLRRFAARVAPARTASAHSDREPARLAFDAEQIAGTIRAVRVSCSVRHHRDGTATIAAGEPDARGVYPLLCGLASTLPGRLGEFEIRPGRSGENKTPQDILNAGCTTNRDVADLILAYVVHVAARPPDAPWELLDYDRLEHLGFDGAARGFRRGRQDPQSRAAALLVPRCWHLCWRA